MTEPRALARHIGQCFGEGGALRISAADAKLWLLALHELIRRGALAEAAFAAPSLASAFPDSAYIRNVAMLLDRMPPAVDDPGFARFVNREDEAVQRVRRAGAGITLLAFCGRHGSLGMPLPVAHRWFGPLDVHVVYLRDLRDDLMETGIPALASDRAGTVRALRELAEACGAAAIVCYGNSTGGYAALVYGLEIGAAAVLAFNAAIHPPDIVPGRHSRASAVLATRDLRALYLQAARRPRTHLVYGASNPGDAASTSVLSGVPGVTTQAVPDSAGHDAHLALIERGQFGPLLHAFVAEQRARIASGDAP